jgi:hypothetical protein
VINQDPVKQSGLGGNLRVARCRQQTDTISRMVLPDFGHGPQGLDEVTQGAKLDDQNFAPSLLGGLSQWVKSGEGTEVDMPCQILERNKNRSMCPRAGRADTRRQRFYKLSGRYMRCRAIISSGKGGAKTARIDNHPPTPAPSNNRTIYQMRYADLDVSAEFLQQSVNVTSDNVSAIRK